MKNDPIELSQSSLIEKQTKELQASETRFRLLIEHNVDGMVIVTKSGTIRFVNPAAEHLFRRPAHDLIGHPLGFPITAGLTTEIDLSDQNGTSTPVEIRVVEVEWEEEQVYLASLRDLTERRRAEEERRLLEAQMQYAQKLESLGVLAGGIAHDFNNLLMTIVARAGLALRALGPESPGHDHLKQIEKAGLRGGELANQMLTYAGRGKPSIQKLNVSKLVKEMAHLLGVSVSKRAVLNYDLAAKPQTIQADPAQLRQVIINLVTNASEAIGERSGVVTMSTGTVKVRLDQLKHWYVAGTLPPDLSVYLDVRDTGCGMTDETLPKIFDPFFTTKFTGRGLGLAALLGIVRAHGGAVAVKSQPGRGTHFRLLFPSALPKELENKKASVTDLDWRGTGTILVVDDEEDVRIASKLILEEIGFRVMTAEDGRAGLAEFQEHRHDITVVLLDLTMPHMNGQELLKEIREINQGIPVILSSGYTEEDALKRFSGTGINGFIQKPYQVEALIDKIRKVIEGNQ